MTQQRYEDCRCEDYPCCGHYDILHGDEGMPEWCDMCGINHSPFHDCMEGEDDDYDDAKDDEDAISIRGAVTRQRVNAFGQRLRVGAPELPGDHYAEDAHLDASWEDRISGEY